MSFVHKDGKQVSFLYVKFESFSAIIVLSPKTVCVESLDFAKDDKFLNLLLPRRGKKPAQPIPRKHGVSVHLTATTKSIMEGFAAKGISVKSLEGAETMAKIKGGEKTYKKYVRNTLHSSYVKGRFEVVKSRKQLPEPIIVPSFNAHGFHLTGCGPCSRDVKSEKRSIKCSKCKRLFHLGCLQKFGLQEPLTSCHHCSS